MVDNTKVIVLQAPVSDREEAIWETNKYDAMIKAAKKLKEEGKETEMMPREGRELFLYYRRYDPCPVTLLLSGIVCVVSAFWAPITAKRYLDLHEKGGADDFFSSDWSDEELVLRLGHMSQLADRQVLVAFSGSDEYVPKQLDSKKMSERLCQAINDGKSEGVAQECFFPNANHNLSEADGDKTQFAKVVGEALSKVK